VYLPFGYSNHAVMPDLVIKSITATRNNIRVVVENQGNAPVTTGFYVDAYVDPIRRPAGAHEGWDAKGVSRGHGLVWAIEVAQTAKPSRGIIAPLLPGETLTLNANDGFYRSGYSSPDWPLAVGTPIYAQADSYPASTPHNGLVLETHEVLGRPYNNIKGPVNSSGAFGHVFAPASGPPTDARSTGLPSRR
jgi:hypothetical protein